MTTRDFLAVIFILFFLVACNKDEVTYYSDDKPEITLDSATGVYTFKKGREFTISPSVKNVEAATYKWLYDNAVISTDPELTTSFPDKGEYFLEFHVENPAGETSVEMRVDIVDLMPPVITLIFRNDEKYILGGQTFEFAPQVSNADDADYLWTLDGQPASEDKIYKFHGSQLGEYDLKLTVTNEDGAAEKEVRVFVVDALPLIIHTPAPSAFYDGSVKHVFADRKLMLKPIVEGFDKPLFLWEVVDAETGAYLEEVRGNDRLFVFDPPHEGHYQITCYISDEADEEFRHPLSYHVICYTDEASAMRSTSGKPEADKVYEYMPAPGQFINSQQAGFTEKITSHDAAVSYAQSRLDNGRFVSLGAWGGYIIVGFDHSIPNKGSGKMGSDFSILGNPHDGGSEPGIVWVMQDVNGNGLPDDEWYELKGSEYGKQETDAEYFITYSLVDPATSVTAWIDRYDRTGTVSGHFYGNNFWPSWVPEGFVYYGTKLRERVTYEGSNWVNGSFDWGYADNWGSDTDDELANPSSQSRKNYFKISNAVYLDGSPANLQYIDFIKVQTGTNANAGVLGENSTEVFGFRDENL